MDIRGSPQKFAGRKGKECNYQVFLDTGEETWEQVRQRTRYRFGIHAPENVGEALELDKRIWQEPLDDAMDKELMQLENFGTYNILDEGKVTPGAHLLMCLSTCVLMLSLI